MEGFVVDDPLGNRVMINDDLCKPQKHIIPNLENHFSSIITAPALLISAPDKTTIYYYRSINWDYNILLTANKAGEHFLVTNCELNPPASFIQQLLSTGHLLW